MECFQSQNNLEAESDKESSTDTSESGTVDNTDDMSFTFCLKLFFFYNIF